MSDQEKSNPFLTGLALTLGHGQVLEALKAPVGAASGFPRLMVTHIEELLVISSGAHPCLSVLSECNLVGAQAADDIPFVYEFSVMTKDGATIISRDWHLATQGPVEFCLEFKDAIIALLSERH